MPRTVEFEYDENAGNAATAACHLSFEKEQDFVVATAKALPWEPPADGNDDRTTVAIVWVESLLRMAKVDDDENLKNVPFFTSCLSADAIKDGVNALLEAGLIDVDDDEEEEAVRDFKDFTELQLRADELAKRVRDDDDDDRMRMDASRWDRFEVLPGGSEYEWLEEVSIGQLTERCGTLEAYSDLCKALGPRALEAARGQGGEQVKVMAGGGQGGQLLALLKDYYLTPSAAALPVAPAFMAYRVPDFMLDTRWPEPLNIELNTLRDYAFDMTLRATWQRASRNDWPAIAQRRLGRAIQLTDLLGELFADLIEHPGQLVREVQRLGDCLLPGEAAQKNVFCRLPEVERKLDEEYEGLVREARANNQAASTTVDRIFYLANTATTSEKHSASVAAGVDDPVMAPKRAQLNRALAERSYVRLKEKYADLLRDKTKEINRMDMLAECMAARTVLPKAVLLACPGTRVADYVGDTDLLGLLVDERPKMRLYLGRCMAYDDEEEEVPEELSAFEYDEGQYDLLRSFKWHKLDPLNHAVLRLKAEGAGTSFTTHDQTQLYHHADMIDKVSKVFGKLFKAIGYPEKVDKEEGLTFEQFMAKLKRLQEYTLGMTTDEAKGTFALIDEYARAGYKAAATHAKITIYGANPADKRLGAWIAEGEPVLVKLNDTIKTVKEIHKFRRNLPNVFGDQPTARTLPGFEKRRELHKDGDDPTPRGGKRQGAKRPKTDGGQGPAKRKSTGKDDDRSEMGRILASKELRTQENPKRVFYFDDGTYSMKNRLIDWPGVCRKFGWNHKDLCGPVIMTFSKDRNRDHNCMDSQHK